MKATETKSTHSPSQDTAEQSSAEQAFFPESSSEQTPFFHPTAASSLQTHFIPQGGTFFQPASVPTLQAKCAACEAEEQQQQEKPLVQFSLTIGQPGDPYEREADRVADQVMQISDQAPEEKPDNLVQSQPLINSILPLMRQSHGKAAQDKHQIRAKELVGQPSSITPALEARLQSSKGQGQPLPEATRSFMEPRFGFDFSQVRVHTDSSAVAMNQELRSQAFAQGSDVYFGAGTTPGKNALTAHELTHVLQQSDNRSQPRLRTDIRTKPRLLALDLTQSRSRVVSRKSANSRFAIAHTKSDVIQRLTQNERLSRGNDIYDLLEGWTSSADSAEILNKFRDLAKADVDQILNVIALRASSSVFDAYKWLHDDMVTSDWKALMQRFIRVNSQEISEIIAYVVVSDYLEGYTSDEDSKQILEYLSIVPGTQLDAVLTAMETRTGKKFADMVDFLFGDMQATDAEALSLKFFGSGSTKAITYAAQWHASKIFDLLSGYTSVRDSNSILQNFRRIGGKADSPDTAAQIAVLTKLSELTSAKWEQTAQDALMKKMQQEDYNTLQKMLPNNLAVYNLEKNFLEKAWDKIAIAYDYVEGFIEYGVCGIAGIVVGIFDAVKSIVGGIVDIAAAVKNIIGWLISKASGGRFARESEENVKNFFTSLGKALGAPLDLIGKMWDATKEEASLIEGPFEECKLSIFWIRKVANFIINILLLIFAGYGAVKASIEAIEAIKNISNFAELVAKVGKLPVALLRKIKSLPGILARGGSRIINAIRNVDTISGKVRRVIGFIQLAARDENFWVNLRKASGQLLESKIQAEKDWWAKRKEVWSSSATVEEGKIAQSEELANIATDKAEADPTGSEQKAVQAESQALDAQSKTDAIEKEIKTGQAAEAKPTGFTTEEIQNSQQKAIELAKKPENVRAINDPVYDTEIDLGDGRKYRRMREKNVWCLFKNPTDCGPEFSAEVNQAATEAQAKSPKQPIGVKPIQIPRQVGYGTTDLSQMVIRERLNLGPKTLGPPQAIRGQSRANYAVFEYRDQNGGLKYIIRKSERMKGHSEQLIHEELQKLGIKPEQVTRIYSERAPCSTKGCATLIQLNYSNAEVTFSFEFGADQASMNAGNVAHAEAIDALFANQ